jgi:DNA-damage-inducible protein D
VKLRDYVTPDGGILFGRCGVDYDAYVRALDAAKRESKKGTEFWMGRTLQTLLGYSSWDKFQAVIERAVDAARSGNVVVENHFSRTGNMVNIGSGAEREKADWFLSRGACYLIAMNADSSKEEVGHAMVYFAVQTRRQEDQDKTIDEAERLRLRLRVMDGNKRLAGAAKHAGVTRFPFFQDAGHQGLYGMSLADVKAHKGLGQKDELLDHAGKLELSANDFRIQLTEHRLNRNNVSHEADAIRTHRQVGKEVRETMERDNGVKPENLPVEKSIKPLVEKHKRALKKAATTDPKLLS